MGDILLGTTGFRQVNASKIDKKPVKVTKPLVTAHYAVNIADRLEKPGWSPLWYVDVVNVPYDDSRGNVQSLTREKRVKDNTFTCAIYPSQLLPMRKNNRIRQRANRRDKRRLQARGIAV